MLCCQQVSGAVSGSRCCFALSYNISVIYTIYHIDLIQRHNVSSLLPSLSPHSHMFQLCVSAQQESACPQLTPGVPRISSTQTSISTLWSSIPISHLLTSSVVSLYRFLDEKVLEDTFKGLLNHFTLKTLHTSTQ